MNMKIKLLYAILALCCSLTIFSQQSTCANPIAITLPYQTSNSTANFGNTYNTAQGIGCGAVPSGTNYFGGNDVFYSFTAPNTGLISVSMTPSASNSSIFVYNACPSSGSACIAGMANTTANARNFNFNATAGQTYLIALNSATSVPTYSLQPHHPGSILRYERNPYEPDGDQHNAYFVYPFMGQQRNRLTMGSRRTATRRHDSAGYG